MKTVFFSLLIVFVSIFIISGNAFANTATMPIQVKVVNLTQMPLEDAIAYCDERSMACPALREEYEENRTTRAINVE